MPLFFQTQTKESKIHGKGVFACEDIPKGAVYWIYQTDLPTKPSIGGTNLQNLIYTEKDLQEFQPQNKDKMRELLHFGFYIEDADVFIRLRDGTAHMNHSDEPNSQIVYNSEKDPRKLYSIAIRDIKAGEEITESYSNYLSRNAGWVEKWMSIYLPEKLSLEGPLNSNQK